MLLLADYQFAPFWQPQRSCSWYQAWARTQAERLRCRAIVEAFVARSFRLDIEEYRTVVNGCDYPVDAYSNRILKNSLDPKGFWRYERNRPPELRLAVVSVVALHDCCGSLSPEEWTQSALIDWKLPETLRLADYGLGHDDRAKEDQPVAAALGPRFYPWQLEQSVEESWEECERHAEILSKLVPSSGHAGDPEVMDEDEPQPSAAASVQLGLF